MSDGLRRGGFLSDRALDHLRRVADLPQLSGTRYEVRERIASGGMGTVYVADDRDLGRKVALKVLSLSAPSGEGRERMIREARALALLEHPGIVPVHDIGALADGRMYYTMKLVDGERLDRHVERTRDLRDRLRIFERICEAVAFAHSRGVIHRDLKPANVMVGSFGEVLVMDWGLAKMLDAVRDRSAARPPTADATPVVPRPDRNTASPGDPSTAETLTLGPFATPGVDTHDGAVLGTPGYMSPEQAAGRAGLVDERSDVYALGAILRDLVTDADRPAPRRLRAVIDKALGDDPAHRYPDVGSLSADVSRFLAGAPVSAYREGVVDKVARFAANYRTPILLVLAYLVVRVMILLFAGT